MRTDGRRIATLVTLVVLTTACGPGGADSSNASGGSGASGTSGASTSRDPAPETTEPAVPTSPGPLTTIPPDVRLPHEATWQAGDPVSTDALPQMCVDPGPDLHPPDTTDQKDVHGTVVDGSTRGESLGVYRDRRAARWAVEVWRRQTARCGHRLDHAGYPQEWTVRKVAISGADEAWQGYDIGTPAPGQEDLAPAVPFITVARVGNAVYVESSRHPGRFDDASLVALGEAEITSVAASVPALAVFGS